MRNATISSLSASAAGSLAKAEQLQEENRQLQEDLTTTRSYVTAAREEGQANVDNTKTAYDALLLVLTTEEPEEGDVAYSKAVETVKNMKAYLSEDAYAIFEETLAAREASDAE